jgi:hypothetical protein
VSRKKYSNKSLADEVLYGKVLCAELILPSSSLNESALFLCRELTTGNLE